MSLIFVELPECSLNMRFLAYALDGDPTEERGVEQPVAVPVRLGPVGAPLRAGRLCRAGSGFPRWGSPDDLGRVAFLRRRSEGVQLVRL